MLLSAVVGFACADEEPEGDFTALYVPVPSFDETSQTCAFSKDGAPSTSVYFDLDDEDALEVGVVLANDIDGEDLPLDWPIAPLQFETECEAMGFLGDVATLPLPCAIQQRATGESIAIGDTGLAIVTLVDADTAEAFRELFATAKQASACCRAIEDAGGMCASGQLGGAASTHDACGALQTRFDAQGEGRSAERFSDVQRFRVFATVGTDTQGRSIFPVRISGRFHGVVPSGDLVLSNRFVQTVNFCLDGCEPSAPTCNVE